ncbi:SLC13 family permease [Natrarchaeobius chitinivorans]|uniref:Sodium:sulfate symporter n=1 Tax=Natrarchaeobius chitinivorans TaxID=1679083 RepID=A0A3N6N779_NATCH|nr:SLC13 family permease [Natrarchaeobius chitinivorans]RQG94252.1 sodium:sulfate symporter [Natrarchaeobius chitinivorans]
MNFTQAIPDVRSPVTTILASALLGGIVFAAAPADGATARMLAITVFCIVLWIFTPIPPSYTGIIGIALIGVTFPMEIALGGFHSPATWLIGFGLLMGEATRRSGLAAQAGHWITARSVPGHVRSDPVRTYRRLLLALGLGAYALALFIPSALVRVLLLAPVLKEAGTLFDSRRARIGLFLGPLFATFYGSVGILTADLPNIIITGISSSIGDHPVSWTEWIVHMFPIMGITRVLVVIGIVYVLYRPEPTSTVQPPDLEGTAVDGRHLRMLAFLFVGTAVWMTDFVHGLHPVVGALVVVILAFLPGVGIVNFEEAVSDVDYSIVFFVASVLAIGEGLAYTGFSENAANYLLEWIPHDAPLAVILLFIFSATLLLALLMEGLAVASVLTPVVIPYAEAAGLPLTPVLMAEAMALGTYFFPYQSAVLITILAEDVVEMGELVRTTVVCSVATIVLLVPLQFAYFTLLY